MSTLRTIRLRERQARTVRLARADVDYLLTYHHNRLDLTPTAERGWYRLQPRGVVGVIHTPNCRVLLAPKIPLLSLAFLLDPAFQPLEAPGEVAPALDEWLRHSFAVRLATLMEERAAHGLQTGYVEVQQSGAHLHGRLDIAAQQRETIRGGMRLHGHVETRAVDIPLNQVPVAVAELFLRGSLREQALRGWEGVTRGPIATSQLGHLLSGTVPSGYRPLLEWCRVIVESLGPGVGTHGDMSFLVDLEKAFERHVTRGLQESCAGTAVTVQAQRWYATRPHAPGQPACAFHPDVLLCRGEQPWLVLDVKWKRLATSALDSADVQQVLAYSLAVGARRAVLVYPGRRDRCWRYDLPHSPVQLEVWSLRVHGTCTRCRSALQQLGDSLRRACAEKGSEELT